MLFTTPLFLFVFLPALLLAYYGFTASLQQRNHIALAASVLFFAWGEPVFVFILAIGTFIDYRISLAIGPLARYGVRFKKNLLTFGIMLNVAALIASKYLDFVIVEILQPLKPLLHWEVKPPHLPLLLGISFITFHRISYLVDSYKGRAIPPRGFLDCALYIFLFPQLIAGPIIRYHDIGSQIQSRAHTVEGFLTGFNRFAFGLAKKLIIADPLGILADKIFGLPPGDLSAGFAWGGVVAYTLQLYFDFSGYSDMAIGLGRMMGFRFPENFNRPYISGSVTDFWRRWHISLSNWMRLYLYIPLGGNRVSIARNYLNLWIVFVVSGIWHGASWNFLVWGAYYGLFLCLERALSRSRYATLSLPAVLPWAYTLFVVMIGWVFFRSPTLHYAIDFIRVLFGFGTADKSALPPWGLMFGNRELVTMLVAALIACVRLPRRTGRFAVGLTAAWSDGMTVRGSAAMTMQFTVTLLLTGVSVAALASADYVPFLYFRF